ncbi:MAG: FKBP-type peptidyl-prolyl cis-trans isomerase [Desulfovibrionaceae bacterium]|nr:FKBP-type peptidyl-prolyl cis-trans isomerase [Desulfovibrionaceae bacterium]
MQKKTYTLLARLIWLACLSALFATSLAFAAQDDEKQAAARIAEYEQKAQKSFSGLKYVVLKEGAGDKPAKGQSIDAHYVGRFMDGRIFDQSLGRGPFTFTVGVGQVIKAWDEALLDMKVGEKRALIVPPELGYGKRGAGNVIPPDSTLFFEVERLR